MKGTSAKRKAPSPKPGDPPIHQEGKLCKRSISANADPIYDRMRRDGPNRPYGHNKWGRTGRLKCKKCRDRRNNCVFDHIDEACVQCKRRGWSCTANDKTGPPSQQHNSNAVESPAALLQSTFALSPAPSVSERFELRDQTPRWRAITPPCDESSIADDLSKVPSEKELVVNVSGSDLFPPPTISTRQYQPLSNDTTHRIEVTTTSSSVVAKNIVEPSIVANYNPCTVSADAPQNSSATVTSGARLVHSPSATVCPSRALSLPDEFVFINHNVDGLYQRYYDDVLRNSLPTANESWLPLYFLGRRVNVQKKFIFFEFPQLQSSPLVKSAQLAFGSFAKNKEFGPHTYRYINCFVRRAITAIENGDLLNLVYASYIIALLYLFAGNSPDSDPAAIQSHILQFARSVSAFLYQRRGIVDERLATVERMWNRIIRIFSILRGSINDAATGLNLEEDHHSVLEQSQCLVPQDIWIWALSHSNEQQIFVKLSTLTSILAAQLSSFVFQVKINPSPNPPEKAISELRHKVDITMEQIRTLITMLPEAFDLVREAAFFGLSKSKKGDLTIEDFNGIGGGASCKSSSRTDRSHVSRLDAGVFCLVSLARAGLINPMDGLKDGSSDIVCWALALCYLCGSEPFCGVRALRIMYELMWAGIILTRQRFPAANLWIKQQIDQTAKKMVESGHWSEPRREFERNGILEVLRDVEGCSSIYDIINNVTPLRLFNVFGFFGADALIVGATEGC